MKTITLTQGYSAIVDDEDYERVSQYNWRPLLWRRADGSAIVYAIRNVEHVKGKRTTQRIHRFILDIPESMHIDHINGNGLDNRRANIRNSTNAENSRNRRPLTGMSSNLKGVGWHKIARKWRARIKLNGKTFHLGFFTSEIEAANAYDAAAMKYFGEFARLNFPGEAH